MRRRRRILIIIIIIIIIKIVGPNDNNRGGRRRTTNENHDNSTNNSIDFNGTFISKKKNDDISTWLEPLKLLPMGAASLCANFAKCSRLRYRSTFVLC